MRSHTTVLRRSDRFELGLFQAVGQERGELRCAHARSHLIVIPRSVVAINQAGRGEKIASPVRAVFYNQGCPYSARSVCSLRETAVFIRVPTAVLADAIRPHDPRVDARGEKPLAFSDGPLSDAVFWQLTELSRHPTLPDADAVLASAVETILANAYQERLRRAPGRHGINDDVYVARAQELISLGLSAEVTLREIAERVGVSPSQLCEAFKRRLGMTPRAFRECLRMRVAATELSGRLGVAPLASRLGYTEPAVFASEFRRRFGLSPEHARARLRLHHPAGC
ncbi:MAG: AraC family transcriptional regulator [Phycisphaerales bacterium]